MGHSELSADITRSDTLLSKFHNTLSDHVRQGPPVDKKSSELVDSALSCNDRNYDLIKYDIIISGGGL